ncbi:short chain dehydrogenase, putative [Talaromyces stipitatus ATCC 10500]|uniref:Short chain dehydrogenase, putative n=1 Tax=Talaromyces stipitatus (strain ATCC 10500 / CBS 375.48 / QM 6759 / NRRL 1006) TaxID=441959 RepID=B8LU00_TALSN|nr:short chain dehydrogenase, putative [Talaromyces stipitatus ATCC 10500]EED23830.1 short chain dehydrogenase, putative [Talaromyces stipitatus ATCC 10500]
MGYSLKNRNVLVTAGSRGLGALIAEKFASEGANVAINYVSNEARAKETESKITSQYAVKTTVIQGDLGVKEDCVRVVKTAIEVLGGLDVVISNAGWTKFAKFADLDALDESEWDKCWSVNVKGHMHVFREALPTFNANPDGGVFIITASIAGLMPSGSSMAYSVTKAASLHLTKCLAKSQGHKVRVNAVCPGLLLTEWGSQFSEEYVENHINQTALKRVAELDDTADLYISLAKNASITGQSLAVGESHFVHLFEERQTDG